MVSLLLLTINRYETTKHCIDMAIKNAGYPFELLVADNGSTDRAVIDYIRDLRPACQILNLENEGIAPMHNMLLKRAKGEYFCLIGNDIELPQNWLYNLVYTYKKVENAGMAGIHCVIDLPPVGTYGIDANAIKVRPSWNVFGTMFWSRKVFNEVGYFNESYKPYGFDDSDYHYRLNKLGFNNFYLADERSIHIGNDVGNGSYYRRMKDESLSKNLERFNRAVQYYDLHHNYYLPFDNEYVINQPEWPDLKENQD